MRKRNQVYLVIILSYTSIEIDYFGNKVDKKDKRREQVAKAKAEFDKRQKEHGLKQTQVFLSEDDKARIKRLKKRYSLKNQHQVISLALELADSGEGE